MQAWVLWALAGLTSVAAVWSIVAAARASRRANAEREKAREAILTGGGRLAMRGEQPREVFKPIEDLTDSGAYMTQGPAAPAPRWSGDEIEWLLAKPADRVESRTVMTPDGPLALTRPPFRLRKSILTLREREYAASIAVRMPGGFVVCPQVRLDALLTPTSPKGRPIDDWRNWRRRVRLRAVDFVICRMHDWSPVVALEIEARERKATSETRDRMIDEALHEAGLALIRCSGDPDQDWAMIEPYLIEPVGGEKKGGADGTGAS